MFEDIVIKVQLEPFRIETYVSDKHSLRSGIAVWGYETDNSLRSKRIALALLSRIKDKIELEGDV